MTQQKGKKKKTATDDDDPTGTLSYLFIYFYIKTLYRIELIIPAREKSHLIQVCQDRRDPTEVIC